MLECSYASVTGTGSAIRVRVARNERKKPLLARSYSRLVASTLLSPLLISAGYWYLSAVGSNSKDAHRGVLNRYWFEIFV